MDDESGELMEPIQYNTKFVKRHVAVASEALEVPLTGLQVSQN